MAAVAVLVLIAVAVLSLTNRLGGNGAPLVSLHAGSHVYELETAATQAAQEKGLGDRSGMAADHGMLFPYGTSDTRCFWMKDMRFPLDIIWVDSRHQVTMIKHNLSPNTYPQSYCATAQYVIELNSGQAAAAGIDTGSKLSF